MVGIVGHMSGGKTYTAVADMLERLASGHCVVSNVRLNCIGVSSALGVPCVFWKQNYFYLVEGDTSKYHYIDLLDYQNYPMGSPRGSEDYQKNLVYIYLDEVSSVFDSITHSASKSIQEVATWARHTEKRGQIIYLIMQFSSELHKRLRNHITEYVSCVNSSKIRLPVLHIGLPWFLKNYIIQTRYAGDEETLISSSQWVALEKRVFAAYDTGQIVFGGEIGRFHSAASLGHFERRYSRWEKLLMVLAVLTALNLFLSLLVLRFYA